MWALLSTTNSKDLLAIRLVFCVPKGSGPARWLGSLSTLRLARRSSKNDLSWLPMGLWTIQPSPSRQQNRQRHRPWETQEIGRKNRERISYYTGETSLMLLYLSTSFYFIFVVFLTFFYLVCFYFMLFNSILFYSFLNIFLVIRLVFDYSRASYGSRGTSVIYSLLIPGRIATSPLSGVRLAATAIRR